MCGKKCVCGGELNDLEVDYDSSTMPNSPSRLFHCTLTLPLERQCSTAEKEEWVGGEKAAFPSRGLTFIT